MCNYFGNGPSMIYYIEKQDKKLLKFYAENDMNKSTTKCRTMHGARLAKLVYKWCSEGVSISIPILSEKAKQCHQ